MDLLNGIILGIVQGITEFLPVSSSGHLILAGAIFPGKIEIGLFTEILLHFATLLAIIAVFYREFIDVFFSPFRIPGIIKKTGASGILKDKNIKMLFLIIISSIPAGIAGIIFHDNIDELLKNPDIVKYVSVLLGITGLILLSSRFFPQFFKNKKNKKTDELKVIDVIAVGTAQAFALLPGISRSGSTISTGLIRGIDRQTIGVFSFLMAVPVIAGATLLSVVGNKPIDFQPVFHISGFLSSFITGYFSLKFLMKIIKMGKFHHFAWYCFFMMFAGLLFS
ncbi:MAG: undecaprenyl-diphosphate phosphatase [Spirochaetes bacterium]|nr:undecaprenyl-diphosphate phosphatase [Spirochaetota bacterium]